MSKALELASEWRETMPRDVAALWGNDVVAELRRLDAIEAELKAIKEAEPVAWQSPDDTENVPKLVWLREKESVFLGYHFDQPFREYRDADGFYTGQQDAESYWARYEDGEPCDPDGWCQLNPPLYTLQWESK